MHGHLVKGSFWDGLKDLGSNWRQLISFLFRLEVLKCGQCEAHLGQSPGFGGKGRRLLGRGGDCRLLRREGWIVSRGLAFLGSCWAEPSSEERHLHAVKSRLLLFLSWFILQINASTGSTWEFSLRLRILLNYLGF